MISRDSYDRVPNEKPIRFFAESAFFVVKPGFDPTREDAAKSRYEEGEMARRARPGEAGREVGGERRIFRGFNVFLQAFSEKIFSERNFFGKT